MQARQLHEQEQLVLVAWHTAAFTRCKRLPALKEIMKGVGKPKVKIKKPPPPQTPEEIETYKREHQPEPDIKFVPLPPEQQRPRPLTDRRRRLNHV